jgi:hypothetical protein
MLLGWLVVGHFVATNPAHSVREPKHVVKRGKTPVLTADQARERCTGAVVPGHIREGRMAVGGTGC